MIYPADSVIPPLNNRAQLVEIITTDETKQIDTTIIFSNFAKHLLDLEGASCMAFLVIVI